MHQKLNTWIDRWFREILGGIIIAFLLGYMGLFASDRGQASDIDALKTGQTEIKNSLIGKNAWSLLLDDIREMKMDIKEIKNKNEADHDSIKARLGRIKAKMK